MEDSNDGQVDVTDSKHDLLKLAQQAVIKQDVMLSATSTQSPLAPVSSVFTMPSVMPHVSMAGGTLGLGADQLFMSVPSVADAATTPTAASEASKVDASNGLSSSTPLLGQPQVAPQFLVANQGTASQGGAHVPVQQILIPVSTGGGSQQFISIPVSLATGGGNQQIQLISTGTGGHFLTSNLTQSLGTNLSSREPSSQPSPSPLAGLPQLITTANGGQLFAVTPQMLASLPLSSPSLSSSHLPSLQHSLSQAVASSKLSQNPHISSSTSGLPPSVSQLLPHHLTLVNPLDLPSNISQLLPRPSEDDNENTVGNSTESTTVDGINLDQIKEFARQFKIRRLSLGLTQTQVGQALSATEGPAYSQSAICRFEKLDITPKSAQKIKPVLERWMAEAEERYKNGVQNLTDFIGSEPSKKRKRRTSFTPQALELLNQYFERNTHPTGTEMTELSERLNYDREVIRVWFCNKRQALKNTIKKLKQDVQ